MATLGEAVDAAVSAGFCTVMANIIPFHQLIRTMTLQSYAVSNSPAAALYQQVCNAPPPQMPSAFSGGQCDNVLYNVTVNRKATTRVLGDPATDTNYDQDFSVQAVGPIRGVTDRRIYPAQSSLVYVGSRNGDVFVSTGFVGGGVQIVRSAVSIKAIAKANGQPDNCGDASPDPDLPDGSNEYPTNITYNDNSGNSFTVPVVIAFGYANVSANAEVNVPVEVKFTLQPELNFNLDFNLNTGKTKPSKPDTPTLPYPDPNEPSPDNPTTDPTQPPFGNPDYPDEDLPDEPVLTRSILKGVIVTVSDIPDYLSEIYQGSNPDLVLPDFGQVQFQIALRGIQSYTKHTKVNSVREFIPCPWQFGGVAVTGFPREGVSWRLTPVYTKQVYVKRFPPETPT